MGSLGAVAEIGCASQTTTSPCPRHRHTPPEKMNSWGDILFAQAFNERRPAWGDSLSFCPSQLLDAEIKKVSSL